MKNRNKNKNLSELDKLIKSQEGRGLSNEHLEDFRNKIGQKKVEIVNKFPSKISLHPKIDSKNQRRLQCSIPFNTLFEEFNLDKRLKESHNLWGEEIKLKNIPLN